MNTNAQKLLFALKSIADGTALATYPGSKQPPTLTKCEIHYIATKAIGDYHTIEIGERYEDKMAEAAMEGYSKGE